jgi:hypothetical protein
VSRLKVFGRGFLIVSLTASNVAQIAAHHYAGGFLIGMAISVVWWGNAHRAAEDNDPWLRWCYGLGAGAGTVFGMGLVKLVYG